MRHARVDSSLSGAMHLVPFSSMYSEPVLPPPKYAQMIPAHVNKYGINCRESVMAGRPGKTRVVPAHQGIIMNGVQYFTFFLSRFRSHCFQMDPPENLIMDLDPYFIVDQSSGI